MGRILRSRLLFKNPPFPRRRLHHLWRQSSLLYPLISFAKGCKGASRRSGEKCCFATRSASTTREVPQCGEKCCLQREVFASQTKWVTSFRSSLCEGSEPSHPFRVKRGEKGGLGFSTERRKNGGFRAGSSDRRNYSKSTIPLHSVPRNQASFTRSFHSLKDAKALCAEVGRVADKYK